MSGLWDLIAGPIIGIIDKVIPDVNARAEAKSKLIELQQSEDFKENDRKFQLALAQIAVNTEEAKSPDLFRGGWRPAVGWVCVFGFTYSVFLRPLLMWVSPMVGFSVPPTVETDTLMTLLFGMLGLGAYRSYEKIKGA